MESDILHQRTLNSKTSIKLQKRIYMLRAKRGFAQSRDCPAQTLDPWFVVQTMDWPRNPGIARAQRMDQDNPGIALR